MERSKYLTEIWKPYPAFPADSLAAGRLHNFKFEGPGVHLELLRDGKILKIHIDRVPEVLGCLQLGDLVAVTQGSNLVLLAPQDKPLPRRSFEKVLLQKWNKYLTDLKAFFAGHDFVEVRTPGLVPCPGTEPSLDVFSTELKVGSRRQKLFLPTSPELHLKKALALGAEKIFEIAPCYRNGEVTDLHQPEFLMLEWYRAYDNLQGIKQDVLHLISALSEKMEVPGPERVHSFSVAELFQRHCHFDFKPDTSAKELKALAEKLSVDVHGAQSIDDYFFLIFMEKIESQLPHNALIFVEKYPPYQAALARLTPDGWGDRFEVYWKGMELANAFHELNDPKVQRLRTQEDLEKKKHMGKEEIFTDEEFFQCLEAGMPPSGGIALGVERLFMALTNTKKITDLRVFPEGATK